MQKRVVVSFRGNLFLFSLLFLGCVHCYLAHDIFKAFLVLSYQEIGIENGPDEEHKSQDDEKVHCSGQIEGFDHWVE